MAWNRSDFSKAIGFDGNGGGRGFGSDSRQSGFNCSEFGSGKSGKMRRLVQELVLKNERIIVLAHTIAMAQKIERDLGSDCIMIHHGMSPNSVSQLLRLYVNSVTPVLVITFQLISEISHFKNVRYFVLCSHTLSFMCIHNPNLLTTVQRCLSSDGVVHMLCL